MKEGAGQGATNLTGLVHSLSDDKCLGWDFTRTYRGTPMILFLSPNQRQYLKA